MSLALRIAVLLCSLGLAFGLVGCTSGSTPGPDPSGSGADHSSPANPPAVTLIGGGGSDVDMTVSDDGPPVPDGFARVNLTVKWPGVTDGASARRILNDCNTIDIEVTGSGISPPVTATITKPDATASLVVPAGLDRTIAFEEKDAGAVHMATTQYGISELIGGQTYSLSFILLDDQEPNDTADDAYAVVTNGSTRWSVLHSATDAEDWFKFDVTGAPNVYRVSCDDVAVSAGTLAFDIIDTDKTSVLRNVAGITAAATTTYSFSSDGTYYVRVTKSDAGATAEYRLSVNDDEGSADVGVTVE